MSKSCLLLLLGGVFLTSDTGDTSLSAKLWKPMPVVLELQDTDNDPLTKPVVKEKLPGYVQSVSPSSESKLTSVCMFSLVT